MQTDFTILGGGIAGLTTAIALQNLGIKAMVFEAAPAIKPVGAGLALAANAIKAFEHLRISEDVIKAGNQLQQFVIYRHDGKVLSKVNSERLSKKYGVNNFTIHRADLHSVLLSKLDPGHVLTGKRSKDLMIKNDGYQILFDDNTSHNTKYLIVAEGINSPIRKKILPEAKIRYSGYTCWRGIADNTDLNITETSETWGSNGRFGIVPLTKNKIYWFACINAPQNDSRFKQFTIDDLYNTFKNYHRTICDILKATRNEDVIWADICDLEPISRYAFDNLVLIGDAAHATTPNLGQGACQAIEDAVFLAEQLKQNSNVAHAFKNFEQKRLKRTHYIVNRSWTIGKAAHLENRFLVWLRNALLRMTPDRVNESQVEAIYNVEFSK